MSWASDLTANRLDATYINNWLDMSGGNCTIRGTTTNLITGTGDVSLNGTTTFTQQIIYNTDMSLNRRLIVGGDVSMSAGSLNVIGNVAINGTLSVGSYKTGSISLSAINSGGGGGGSSAYTINATDTTFNIDMSYNAPVKINGDISLNESETYSYLYTSPQIFKPTDAKTTVARKWQDIEISSTGQYQVAVVGGNLTNGSNNATDVTGNVWISTNYGVTWTEKVVGGGVQCWISAMISGDGSIMTVKAKGNILYKSIDYGANWTQISISDISYADMTTVSSPFSRPGYPMFMTTDGNTLITGSADATTTWLTRLIISKNGGTSWTVLPHDGGSANRITSYNMSKSGQYICITYGNSLAPKYSPDYGTTFYRITNASAMQSLNTSNILLYGSGLCAISNNGYAYMHNGLGTVLSVNVNSGTITDTSNNAVVTSISTPVNTLWSISTSYNGQYVTIYGRITETITLGSTITYTPRSYVSYDYGQTFVRIIGVVIMTVGTNLNRVWSTRFSADNKYIATVKENDYVYVSRLLFSGSSTKTQVSASTTMNVPARISFNDGSDISANMYPNNKEESDGTTFKATTFRNMIVQGSFASNPQLSTSDYRIKTNVQTLDETHILDNLRPVRYYQTQLARNDIGFIAHELQEQYPDLVEGEKDGDNMQSVDYNGILALLINEVQRLKADIKQMRAANAAKKAAA